MHGLADALDAAGYAPHLIRYSTLAASPQAAAGAVQAQLQDTFGARPIFAVTHSLGGVLIRYLRKPLAWKRIVMLAPPNQGSAIARAIRTTVGNGVFGISVGKHSGRKRIEHDCGPSKRHHIFDVFDGCGCLCSQYR
jgi:triacylglycerol esterase/lipase EstA (alpha/beta hydrolase family)